MSIPPHQLKQLHNVLKKVNTAIEQGHTTPALQKLKELDSKFPNQAMILTLLGKVQGIMGRHDESIEAYGRAVENKKTDGELRFFYAYALQKGGRHEQSLEEYERSLYYSPKNYNSLRHKCSVLIDLERLDEAVKALDKLEKTHPIETLNSTQALGIKVIQARLSPKLIDPNEVIEGIEKYVHREDCEIPLRTPGYWQLGKLYDQIKEYDKAFEAYKLGKELNKKDWDYELHSSRIDQLISCWTKNQDIPFSNIDGSNMIFIVGMMRSGTSLTEQMLAQIPEITPGGEMNSITRQIIPIDPSTMHNGRPYALTPHKYTQQNINKMAQNAKSMYDQAMKTQYLTDKQPYNYAHVPLIAHMFPGCKIIHCKRDPLDCCVSNFTQSFSRPHMQTHDLYWLGRYYRDYERLMAAWSTLDEVNMIDLQYELLVSDPETETKRVLDFLGFEWTPTILDFHKSTRIITTASRDQVRKPMYTSSVQKYKRYEQHLDELKRGLEIEQES